MEGERPPLSPKQHPTPESPAHTPPTIPPHSTGAGAHPAPHPDASPWLCLVSGHPTGLPAGGGEAQAGSGWVQGQCHLPRRGPPLGHTAAEDWIQACPPWMGCVPGGGGSSCQPGVAPPCPGHLPAQPATLTCRTTPTTGRFRVCPGTGAGHWSISLHAVVQGVRVRSRPCGSGLPRPLGPTAGRCDSLADLMATHLLPGRAPACQSTRGRSGSAAPGTAG